VSASHVPRGEVVRVAGIVAVLTLATLSGADALARSHSHQEARALGRGVFLSIDESHVEPAHEVDGLIAVHVTLSNHGSTPLKVDYLTFSLSSAAGARSLALLPSELNGQVAPSLLLHEGVLAKGQTMVAVLYFRSLSPNARSVELRVDLANAEGRPVSRSFLPLAAAR
jgi:hypothetical protein